MNTSSAFPATASFHLCRLKLVQNLATKRFPFHLNRYLKPQQILGFLLKRLAADAALVKHPPHLPRTWQVSHLDEFWRVRTKINGLHY